MDMTVLVQDVKLALLVHLVYPNNPNLHRANIQPVYMNHLHNDIHFLHIHSIQVHHNDLHRYRTYIVVFHHKYFATINISNQNNNQLNLYNMSYSTIIDYHFDIVSSNRIDIQSFVQMYLHLQIYIHKIYQMYSMNNYKFVH